MALALYRRYRPDTFSDLVGQEHVTDLLQAALNSGRSTHAYLFSGPRGCGKTTSARIMARCLNCAQGPTAQPCGECESCRELATGGRGSIDVVEIDAASNSGVDNARDLRERAAFAPARDRYKVFIIDEAHMISKEGFNALLKLVEEPPEHVKFIFATTEPEKVLGTIRSRTHHYPFRLVPPSILVPYLADLCEREGVPVEEGVLPLVVRAGGGSVRDSLSLLDQLIAGSGDAGLTYSLAADLLGFADAAMLDAMIDALGRGDGAAAMQVIDEMAALGQDPQRFTQDLLQRLRDVLVCALVPDQAAQILPHFPTDQLAGMAEQAAVWGTRLLSRRADLVDEALRTMGGATPPRLQLELLVGRMLAADSGAGPEPQQAAPAVPRPAAAPPAPPRTRRASEKPRQEAARPAAERPAQSAGSAPSQPPAQRVESSDSPAPAAPPTEAPAAAPQPRRERKPAPRSAGGTPPADLQSAWKQIVEHGELPRSTRARLVYFKVTGSAGTTLYVDGPPRHTAPFAPGSEAAQQVNGALQQVLGPQWSFQLGAAPGQPGGGQPPAAPEPDPTPAAEVSTPEPPNASDRPSSEPPQPAEPPSNDRPGGAQPGSQDRPSSQPARRRQGEVPSQPVPEPTEARAPHPARPEPTPPHPAPPEPLPPEPEPEPVPPEPAPPAPDPWPDEPSYADADAPAAVASGVDVVLDVFGGTIIDDPQYKE